MSYGAFSSSEPGKLYFGWAPTTVNFAVSSAARLAGLHHVDCPDRCGGPSRRIVIGQLFYSTNVYSESEQQHLYMERACSPQQIRALPITATPSKLNFNLSFPIEFMHHLIVTNHNVSLSHSARREAAAWCRMDINNVQLIKGCKGGEGLSAIAKCNVTPQYHLSSLIISNTSCSMHGTIRH